MTRPLMSSISVWAIGSIGDCSMARRVNFNSVFAAKRSIEPLIPRNKSARDFAPVLTTAPLLSISPVCSGSHLPPFANMVTSPLID